MEEELANLSLLDDEEEAFQEEAVAMERTYQFCLVGRCLTDSVVHFPSLRNAMADLWHPIGGICITDLGKNGIFSNSFMRLTLLGESYCPFRVRIEPSKIIFGWDLSLRAVVRHQNTAMSRWLREADGSQCNAENLEICHNGQNNWRNWSKDDSVNDGLVNGPMDLVLEGENDPFAMLEGKKRQRVVDGSLVLLGSNAGIGSMDLLANSGEQSSRAQ
ncbi:hypothetical protein Goari_022858 [Gossypium aridum]|uniref:DUF4283 domain-containing protein n=1 Tax=Gossypium aridum TaxID=34290 RepID=A0A7J8YPY9_GOSAI|nr:hypothetical protein [Gossypium aridum]